MITSRLQRRCICVAVAHALAAAIAFAPPASAAAAVARPRRLGWSELKQPGSAEVVAKALAPLGEWMELPDGRRAWRPSGVSDTWRPYVNGSWAWTEAGWYWVSDEPWAWATYHYGRWRLDARLGWAWIPGDAWAPARVVWRYGAGAVGWAPATDDDVVLPGYWTFLPARRFAGVDAATDGVPPPRAATLFATTRRGTTAELARGPRPLDDGHAVALPVVAPGPRSARTVRTAEPASPSAGAAPVRLDDVEIASAGRARGAGR